MNSKLRFSDADFLFIGIHVRRGDFTRHMKKLSNGQLLDQQFYFTAMEVFRRKFSDKVIVFVVASDDMAWCRDNLGHDNSVYFPQYTLQVGRRLFP